MNDDTPTLERKVRALVAAIEAGAGGEELAAYYHPDVVHHVLPNAFLPAGARRNREEIIEDADRARRLLTRQILDVGTLTEAGDRIVLEMTWTGFLAAPVGVTRAGDAVKGHLVQVMEFEDGLIIRQRTYACYQPF